MRLGVISYNSNYVLTPTEPEIKGQSDAVKNKCHNYMQVLFNPHLGPLRERPDTVRAGINWCGCEGHLGEDIIRPNLEAQECLPPFKLCGTEDAEVMQ